MLQRLDAVWYCLRCPSASAQSTCIGGSVMSWETPLVCLQIFYLQWCWLPGFSHLTSRSPLSLLGPAIIFIFSVVADILFCSPKLTTAVFPQGLLLALGVGEVARLHDPAFCLTMAVDRTQLSPLCILSLLWSMGSTCIVCADHSGRNVQRYRVHTTTWFHSYLQVPQGDPGCICGTRLCSSPFLHPLLAQCAYFQMLWSGDLSDAFVCYAGCFFIGL